jgi:hypothetical protein
MELYDLTKSFAEKHRMVNEFGVIGSEEELSTKDYEYRSMQLLVQKANISRELNSPVYQLDFSVIVVDKIDSEDDRQMMLSTEENIFVVSQFQDYLLQQDNDVTFEDIEVVGVDLEDHTVTTAFSNFTVRFSRKPYVNEINKEA